MTSLVDIRLHCVKEYPNPGKISGALGQTEIVNKILDINGLAKGWKFTQDLTKKYDKHEQT